MCPLALRLSQLPDVRWSLRKMSLEWRHKRRTNRRNRLQRM